MKPVKSNLKSLCALPYSAIIDSACGKLGFKIAASKLVNVEFLPPTTPLIKPIDAEALRVADELQQYLRNPKHRFSLSFILHGTPFQCKVWQAMREIPVGTAVSYGDLAKQLKTSARAVGNACRRNPLPLIVPCHRIVGKSTLGGFNGARKGAPLVVKSWLLQHENYSFVK